MNEDFPHESVLRDEVVSALDPKPGSRILDVTLGLGGHAELLLSVAGEGAHLVGLDADNENLNTARKRLERFGDRVELRHENFASLPELSLGSFDVIFADLGVSSPHFDEPKRGFSFRKDGPLDMRLDRSSGKTAADHIDQWTVQQLSDILREYGEVRQHGKLAEALKDAAPKTTKEAYAVLEAVAGYRAKSIAPQVFQALRIAVNDELRSLEILLHVAPKMLNSGGRLGIISFHSLEDRMVKQRFRDLCTVEKDETTGADIGEADFLMPQRKAIKPSEEEMQSNPRCRSARLRVLQRRR